MNPWKFIDYCSPAGNNLIEKWYSKLPIQAQTDFDVTLKLLSITTDWRDLQEFKRLTGKHSQLGEIRFTSNKVRYRPAGYFGPGASTFTILIGCTKKQNIYDPPHAFDLALKRKGLLEQGKASTHERKIPKREA